jgi:glycine oxidase
VPDVVVIGAGIVGSACAYELAKAGAHVTVLEYGKAGMQATNAAAGLLSPLSESDEPTPLLRAGTDALRGYPAVVGELQERCGFDVEFRQHGILRVAFDDAHAAALRRRYAWQRQLGLGVEWLDAAACRELEPRLSERVTAGVFATQEAAVSNQLIALAMIRAAVASGAALRERTPVTRVVRRRGRIAAIQAGDEIHPCDTVVLAAGARSGQVGRRLGVALPVSPMRGQMIALGGMVTPIRHPVWGPEGYLVPRANGLIFAGATVERVGFRLRTTKRALRSLRAMSVRLVPQLRAAQTHFDWAGLRPDTPDHLPIIGPVAGTNVVAATGHYRSGILLGPWTGQLVARGIADGDWSRVPEACRPERFATLASATA